MDSCLTIGGSVTHLNELGLGCSAAPTTGSLEIAGTWSASAEGVVSDGTHTSGDAVFHVPTECAHTAAQPIACPRLAGPIADFIGTASLACVDSASAWCDCSATYAQTGSIGFISTSPATSSTYTTADGVLTVSDGTNQTEYSYCVAGDTLTLSLVGASKTGSVTGTILLQKQ
jgi:hypothetical protein